jgi:hypothetical protein
MSNYTKTTNFLAKDSLPDADTAKIIRGSEFDTEFNNLVTAVASKANTLSPTLTGIPTAPTAAAGTNTLQVASTAFVTTAANAVFPSGGIIMWSGSVATIPVGWLLCNGSNSTPDLRNRFVIGAGSTYAVDATGGSANSDLQAHNHTLTDPGHNHNYTSPVIGSSYAYTDQGVAPLVYFPTANGATTTTSTTGITLADAGSGDGTNANLPPYYALAYIMKS